MSSYLYINAKGYPVTRHSYSGGVEFQQWPYKYYLKRVLGWYEKDRKAAPIFGRAVEYAVEQYHLNNAVGGVEAFEKYWSEHKDKELIFSDGEGSWEGLLRAGREMLKLYGIRQGTTIPIPLNTRRWQVELRREVFPGTRLAGIEMTAKLDVIAKEGECRRIIDIKTSEKPADETPFIVSHDLQLRTYSWTSGIRPVALLTFKKSRHELEKGSSISFLKGAGEYAAGSDAVVALFDKASNEAIVLPHYTALDEMNKAMGDKPTSNAGKARKMEFLSQHGLKVKSSILTRQKIQFTTGIVSEASAKEAGDIAGYQISAIVNAREKNFWPNTASIRYPNDLRNDPYFKAFVLKDEKFRDEWFERRDEDWLDGDEQEAA